MRTPIRSLLASLLLCLSPLSLAADVSVLGYRAADPSAPEVTSKNLLASERFWPYRVSLTSAWQPPGSEKPLRVGEAGILVRIEDSGVARIDFGGLGVHETPVGRTDLLANANKIRRGELGKLAPNFVTAIGPRLADPASDTLKGVDPEELVERSGYLCVFADPTAQSFPELAKALAPLKNRSDVQTVVFPQGRVPDADVMKRLRAVDWMVPYVFGYLAEGYTDSLVGRPAALPFVLLQTADGRVVLEGAWRPELPSELGARLDATFSRDRTARR